jgi:hypothetical protein
MAGRHCTPSNRPYHPCPSRASSGNRPRPGCADRRVGCLSFSNSGGRSKRRDALYQFHPCRPLPDEFRHPHRFSKTFLFAVTPHLRQRTSTQGVIPLFPYFREPEPSKHNPFSHDGRRSSRAQGCFSPVLKLGSVAGISIIFALQDTAEAGPFIQPSERNSAWKQAENHELSGQPAVYTFEEVSPCWLREH